MTINIVLVNPQIPQNTGNIARLSAATDSKLHLIKPLGFELSDKYLKRAGLDYWEHVDWTVYENWQDFLDKNVSANEKSYFFTTKTEKKYSDINKNNIDEIYLVFGSETKGLDSSFLEDYKEKLLTIPINKNKVRSLNLANSVAIAVYYFKD